MEAYVFWDLFFVFFIFGLGARAVSGLSVP